MAEQGVLREASAGQGGGKAVPFCIFVPCSTFLVCAIGTVVRSYCVLTDTTENLIHTCICITFTLLVLWMDLATSLAS